MRLTKEYAIWYAPGEPEGSLQLLDEWSDMTSVGWVKVGAHTVEVEVDVESSLAVNGLIAKLAKCKADIRAEAAVKANAIDKHISTLARLEYCPPADTAAPKLKEVELVPEGDDDIPF